MMLNDFQELRIKIDFKHIRWAGCNAGAVEWQAGCRLTGTQLSNIWEPGHGRDVLMRIELKLQVPGHAVSSLHENSDWSERCNNGKDSQNLRGNKVTQNAKVLCRQINMIWMEHVSTDVVLIVLVCTHGKEMM